jgi:hypothetical protein
VDVPKIIRDGNDGSKHGKQLESILKLIVVELSRGYGINDVQQREEGKEIETIVESMGKVQFIF